MKDVARSPAGIVGLPFRARGEGKGMTPTHGPGQAVRESDAGRARGRERKPGPCGERAFARALAGPRAG